MRSLELTASSAGAMAFPLSIRQNSSFAPPNFSLNQTIPEGEAIVKHIAAPKAHERADSESTKVHEGPQKGIYLVTLRGSYCMQEGVKAHSLAGRLRRVGRCPLVAPTAVSASATAASSAGACCSCATGSSATGAASSS